jgi:signal transduction histidine kinase
MSPLERSAREEDLSEWLEERIADSWEMAATFGEAGFVMDDLDALAAALPEEALKDVLAWLDAGIESDRIVLEINAAAGRISDLVASIKVYSHMDQSPAHKPTDVRTGVDNTLTMLGHKLKKKGISLAREYDADLPLIPANAGELNQVWTNLIDNAIDAVADGGILKLRARRNDMWVEVAVIDNGPGIPEELRSRIFEPFFTTKEVGIGTGLGLGIAQRIVRTHQGDIDVRSKPGETMICVRLPVNPASPVSE